MGKGKAGFLTPKAISNRMKAAGLQKLKWWCQMCEKQCRDENGFKCHTQSEGHLRNMQIFKSNSGQMMNDFSRQFEGSFMSILSSRHSSKFVKANSVYQEVIADKKHVHMNSTYWSCLSSFLNHLAEQGRINMEERENGLYIQYIDGTNKDFLEKQQILESKKRKKTDEQAREKEIKRMRKLEKEFDLQQQQLVEETKTAEAADTPKFSDAIELNFSVPNNKGKQKKSKLISRKKPKETPVV